MYIELWKISIGSYICPNTCLVHCIWSTLALDWHKCKQLFKYQSDFLNIEVYIHIIQILGSINNGLLNSLSINSDWQWSWDFSSFPIKVKFQGHKFTTKIQLNFSHAEFMLWNCPALSLDQSIINFRDVRMEIQSHQKYADVYTDHCSYIIWLMNKLMYSIHHFTNEPWKNFFWMIEFDIHYFTLQQLDSTKGSFFSFALNPLTCQ